MRALAFWMFAPALFQAALAAPREGSTTFEAAKNIDRLCRSSAQTEIGKLDRIAVSFFIIGVSDFIAKEQQYGTLSKKICIPAGTTINEICKAVCRRIIASGGTGPTGLEVGVELVGIGLVEAFPCK